MDNIFGPGLWSFELIPDDDDLAYRAHLYEKRSPLKSHIKYTRDYIDVVTGHVVKESVRKCSRRTERPIRKFCPLTIGMMLPEVMYSVNSHSFVNALYDDRCYNYCYSNSFDT
jgi:hypothetical protein